MVCLGNSWFKSIKKNRTAKVTFNLGACPWEHIAKMHHRGSDDYALYGAVMGKICYMG